jgi:hypothetical protein
MRKNNQFLTIFGGQYAPKYPVCGINLPISAYYARFSFASIARNDCGISKDDIHEALNHSDPSMKITDIYIKKDWSVIDSVVRRVLDVIK